MAGGLPSISGRGLMGLLESDGWEYLRDCKHGKAYTKQVAGVKRVTTIPNKTGPLPPGTLHAILGEKQTGIGRAGLLRLLGG